MRHTVTWRRPSSERWPIWRLGREDLDRRVRQTTLALLQQMGQVSYADELRYLEGEG